MAAMAMAVAVVSSGPRSLLLAAASQTLPGVAIRPSRMVVAAAAAAIEICNLPVVTQGITSFSSSRRRGQQQQQQATILLPRRLSSISRRHAQVEKKDSVSGPSIIGKKKTLWFFARPGIAGFVLVEKREPSERTGLVVAERVFWHVLRCDVGTDAAVHEEILGSSNDNNAGPISVTPESEEISWVPVLPHVLTAAMANFMFGYHIGSAILTYCTVICKFFMAQCAC
jgi:hypothetical protein